MNPEVLVCTLNNLYILAFQDKDCLPNKFNLFSSSEVVLTCKKILSKIIRVLVFFAACFNTTNTVNQDLFVILALLNIGNLATQNNNRT